MFERELDGILAKSNPEQLTGELALNLERKTMDGLSFWPGDLATIVAIRKWMDRASLPTPTKAIPESTNLAEQVWKVFVFKCSLDFLRNLVVANDAKILVHKDQHGHFLHLLENDPIQFMETFFFPLLVSDFSQHRSSHFVETWNMLPVKEWCAANQLEYAVHLYKHAELQELVFENKRQMEEMGSTDVKRRFDASYPLFRSVFDVCRSLYFSSAFFRRLVDGYKELSNLIPKELKDLISPYLWDEVVWELNCVTGLRRIETYLMDMNHVQDLKGWPVHLDGDPLPGSAMLFLLLSNYYEDVVAGNESIGKWFEDLLYRELRTRRIPVIKRNLLLSPPPSGEIDLVCYDDRAVYLVEAKDYGPRSRQGYFSSEEYKARLGELEQSLTRFNERLCWLESNRSQYSLPSHIPIQGLCVTSHVEPHIEAPPSIKIVALRDLGNVFTGPPVQPKIFRGNRSLLDMIEFSRQHRGTSVGNGWKKETDEDRFIDEKIEDKFGSYEAYKLYKYASEMFISREQANKKSMIGMGVGEMIATHEKYVGLSFNFWDVSYVTYYLELFDWDGLLRGWQQLISGKFVKVDDNGYVVKLKDVKPAYYRKTGDGWSVVTDQEKADIVLYTKTCREEGNLCIGSFVDALVRRGNEFHLVEKKIF
jgi:hypothetical protein